MSISQHQFAMLTEMGIPLWQRSKLANNSNVCERSNSSDDIAINSINSAKNQNKENINLPINFTEISKQQIFEDILLSINLSLADITQQKNQLLLGLLNWQFVNDESITLHANTLSSPTLNNISTSSQLKRQLWQILQDHILQENK